MTDQTPGSVPQPPGRSTRRAARRAGGTAGGGGAAAPSKGALERFRVVILGGVVVVGLIVVGVLFMGTATAKPYTCGTLMTPGPVFTDPDEPAAAAAASVAPAASPAASPAAAASPAPAATPRTGYPAADLGRGHVSKGTTIAYDYCPPTSGQHYNEVNLSPLARAFYGPEQEQTPGSWVHNLEHGYVVLLYKGDPGAETLADLEAVMESAPPGPLSEACRLPNKVIAVRFDSMSGAFGAVSWDRAMILDAYDRDALAAYAAQWQDAPVTPEQAC